MITKGEKCFLIEIGLPNLSLIYFCIPEILKGLVKNQLLNLSFSTN